MREGLRMLNNKVVYITGASRGIGSSIAQLFAKNGAQVLINGKENNSLESLKEEIRTAGYKEPIIYAYDVADYNEVKKSFQKVKKDIGYIDILVNNAGILEDALLGMINENQIDNTLNINLKAVMYHMQFASRLMMKRKTGSIINVSSIIGKFGNAGQVVYGASKAGVIGATISAAKELAPYQIRVNTILPGFIDTDMVKQIPREKFEERIKSIKMNRIGQPEDVANVALFLASDLSSYVTGQTIGVDGGMVL